VFDVPAMGADQYIQTAGYFEKGDIPSFKLLQQSTGDLIALGGDIPAWTKNGIYALTALTEIQPVPETFVLKNAYPNPFNPVTTLEFGIPVDGHVSISIYNLQGRVIETLTDHYMDAGYYSVSWNADNHASGMYFIEMVIRSGDDSAIFRDIRKILYLK
jgi:hypothetical protein